MIYHTPPETGDGSGGAAVMPIWTIEGEKQQQEDDDNDDDSGSVDNYADGEDDTRILLEKVG